MSLKSGKIMFHVNMKHKAIFYFYGYLYYESMQNKISTCTKFIILRQDGIPNEDKSLEKAL